MIKSFFWSKKWFPWAYGVGSLLVLSSYGLVHLSVLFNKWYGDFYNIMQKPKLYTLQDFNVGLERFMWLAICYIVLIVIMNFVARHYVFRWRTAIIYNYLPRWRHVPVKIEGESQRMQEDPAEFANILESLGLKVVNAIMTLVAFVPVLWQLSSHIDAKSRHLLDFSTLWTSLVLWLAIISIIVIHWRRMAGKISLKMSIKNCVLSAVIIAIVVSGILEFLGFKIINIIITLTTLPARIPVLWKTDTNLGIRMIISAIGLVIIFILSARQCVCRLKQLKPYVAKWSLLIIRKLREFRDWILLFMAIFVTIKGYHFLSFLWTFGEFPGSLVWTALTVSIGGMAITWTVAYWLPKLEYNNQVVEAAFRKELVLAEEDKTNHSNLMTLFGLFTGVKFNYYRLYLHYGYVDLWLHMYNQTMVVLPYIVAGPSLMAEIATLGVVVQVANAFGEVRSSLAVIIDNWTRVTRVRSIWRRLHEFEANVDKYTISTTETAE